ncbi:DNA helicase UvrD, partial [Bacillus sp. MBGLi97]
HNDFHYYEMCFLKVGIMFDWEMFSRMWWCFQVVCDFIFWYFNIGIDVYGSYMIKIETISDWEVVVVLYVDDWVIKLFFKEYYCYGCYLMNWA